MTNEHWLPIETERLVFRLWRDSDLELALGLWGDPRVTKYITASGELTEDGVRDWLDVEISREKKFGVQYWPVFLKSTGRHVGCCGLRPHNLSSRVFEIGFHIRADSWGHGFATEAARGVMSYAFNTLSVNQLFAGHHPQNEISKIVLQKLGFHYTHDEYYAPTGLQHPSYIMTAEEYRRTRSSL
jgi:RimJ/RimL family protein N-acetyltransferase